MPLDKPKSNSKIQIQTLTSPEDMEALRHEWDELLADSRSGCFTLTYEWLSTWWKIFGEGHALFILAAREEDRLIGLGLFLRRTAGYGDGLLSSRQIEFLGADIGKDERICSDYLDFIIRKDHEKEVTTAFINHLMEAGRHPWDELVLSGISSDSPNLPYLEAICQASGLIVKKRVVSPCVYLTLPSAWDTFLQERSRDLRYKIVKGRKKLEETGPFRYITLGRKDDPVEMIRILMDMRRARPMDAGEIDSWTFPKFQQFHQDVVGLLQKKDLLWFSCLYLKDVPIAILYNIRFGDRLFFYQTGFVQQASNQIRPGLLIHSYCIEEAISKGILEYDFLRGPEPYKSSWSNTCRHILEVRICRKNSKIKTAWLLQDLKSYLRHLGRKQESQLTGPR